MRKTFVLVFLFLIPGGFLFFCPNKALATISFSIANPNVSLDDEVEVDATISGLTSSSCSANGCYLQAEFRIQDETKDYFGFTYNNSGDYVDYFSNPVSTDQIKNMLFNFVPVSGSWSGKLKAKNNFQSNNYDGPGLYSLRFRRFSGNSTNATSGDSNPLSINLKLDQPTPSPTPTPSPKPTTQSSLSSDPSPIPTQTGNPSASFSPTISSSQSSLVSTNASIPKLLAEKTEVKPSPQQRVLAATQEKLPLFFIVGGFILVVAAIALIWDEIRNLIPF